MYKDNLILCLLMYSCIESTALSIPSAIDTSRPISSQARHHHQYFLPRWKEFFIVPSYNSICIFT
jgi:hypothetical protein